MTEAGDGFAVAYWNPRIARNNQSRALHVAVDDDGRLIQFCRFARTLSEVEQSGMYRTASHAHGNAQCRAAHGDAPVAPARITVIAFCTHAARTRTRARSHISRNTVAHIFRIDTETQIRRKRRTSGSSSEK